jgi:hypothetical protein
MSIYSVKINDFLDNPLLFYELVDRKDWNPQPQWL